MIHSSTFQSTLPRGERPNFGNSHRSTFNFNPRSREGSDPVCTLPPCPPGISIHAPARGATGSLRHISLGHRDFNPRSREGSDDFLFATCYSINYFNPRSREGSDGQSVSAESIHIAISIHAPARGATIFSILHL